ncbi:MotB family protein [Microvirga puerhi]|uniref:MotB family protein n=1 Tax=Microvirga puerhi TaxID=2876078 RepID=A0ABS7VSN6_9HYPH|nr:MotB family protein [Microvirga puerhi]MBZ6078573.1 MotB family protein [Microvirga puerhi]
MPDPDKQEIIVVRRYEAEEEHHKGGVWKIAHADFMTAMMAFFLVMWLISVTDNETRSTISNYFNPLKLAESTTDRKGLNDPKNDSQQTKEGSPNSTSNKASTEGKGGRATQTQPDANKSKLNEGALFQDPYAVLAKLAMENDTEQQRVASGIDVPLGEAGDPGTSGGEAYRDPFDPLYWQVAPLEKPRTKIPGNPGTTMPAPREGIIDALAPSSKALTDLSAPEKNDVSAAGPATVKEYPVPGGAQPSKAAPALSNTPKSNAESADADLRAEIAKAVQPDRASGPSPRVEVNRTGEGLLISVTDDLNFSMFAIGSAEPQPKVVRAMDKIAKIIGERSGKIIIRGHTDGRPFRSDNYDNWRLSTARAHMAAYMLIRGGIKDSRIASIEGRADRDLKKQSDPNAAENRRIEILLQEASP